MTDRFIHCIPAAIRLQEEVAGKPGGLQSLKQVVSISRRGAENAERESFLANKII